MKKFLGLILLFSLFLPFSKQYALANDYVLIDEPIVINCSQYSVFDSQLSISKVDSLFSGDIQIKPAFTNITYNFGLYYMNKENNEILYDGKEKTYNGLNSFYDSFTYSFEISLEELAEQASFTFVISSTVLSFKHRINFFITNPILKIKLNNSLDNKIYTSISFKDGNLYNPYFVINPSYLIQGNKDVFYYDKYDFATLYISSGGGAINNSYLYIYDNYNHYSSVGEVRDITDGSKKYIRTAFKRLNGSKQNHMFYFYEENYVNPVTNIMYKTYENGFIANETALYMPLKYYDLYKNITVGIEINNYFSGKFSLYFEFEINFLPNFRKDEVVINKGNEQVSEDDSLKEIKI